MSDLYLPQGRFVFGNIYKGMTTDRTGRPLTTSKGAPRTDFTIGYAIPKTPGVVDWKQEVWGQAFVREATAGFPQGQHQMNTFAWKVIDGDSTELNQNMKRPIDAPGHKGHWVLRLKSGFGPQTAHINATGRPEPLVQVDAIMPGDYIQAHISVAANQDAQKPGIYLNPNVVCLMSKGERIVSGPDVSTMAFGQNPGAAVAAPPAAAPVVAAPPAAAPPVVAPPPVVVAPNPQFLAVFPPAGWAAHPTAAGYWWKGQEALTEADLRARMAAGQA